MIILIINIISNGTYRAVLHNWLVGQFSAAREGVLQRICYFLLIFFRFTFFYHQRFHRQHCDNVDFVTITAESLAEMPCHETFNAIRQERLISMSLSPSKSFLRRFFFHISHLRLHQNFFHFIIVMFAVASPPAPPSPFTHIKRQSMMKTCYISESISFRFIFFLLLCFPADSVFLVTSPSTVRMLRLVIIKFLLLVIFRVVILALYIFNIFLPRHNSTQIMLV